MWDSCYNNGVCSQLRRKLGRAELSVASVARCEPVLRLIHRKDRLSGALAYYDCPNIQIWPHFARSSNFQRGAMTKVEVAWGL